jgi:hypothetical protein
MVELNIEKLVKDNTMVGLSFHNEYVYDEPEYHALKKPSSAFSFPIHRRLVFSPFPEIKLREKQGIV